MQLSDAFKCLLQKVCMDTFVIVMLLTLYRRLSIEERQLQLFQQRKIK